MGTNEGRRGIKKDQHITDPCVAERKISLKCMEEHNYDRETFEKACARQIDNLKNCKKFWHTVMLERKSQNIVPPMPPPEEREAIRKERLNQNRPQTPKPKPQTPKQTPI